MGTPTWLMHPRINKIQENLHDYIQKSFVYFSFNNEAISSKAALLNQCNLQLGEMLKEAQSKNLQGKELYNFMLDNKIAWSAFGLLSKIGHVETFIPMVINNSVIFSFQVLEHLFFEFYKDFSGKDYMKGDLWTWVDELQKYSNSTTQIRDILWKDIFLMILEYNKRRNTYVHADWIIGSSYEKFLVQNPSVKIRLIEYDRVDSLNQPYTTGFQLVTTKHYYFTNQILLDFVACILSFCIHLDVEWPEKTTDFINEISDLILSSRNYLLLFSVLKRLNDRLDILDDLWKINLLLSYKKISFRQLKNEQDELLAELQGKKSSMWAKEGICFWMIAADHTLIEEKWLLSWEDLTILMNSSITTEFLSDPMNLDFLRKIVKSDWLDHIIHDKLSHAGLRNLTLISSI